jgi:hypothetical protein
MDLRDRGARLDQSRPTVRWSGQACLAIAAADWRWNSQRFVDGHRMYIPRFPRRPVRAICVLLAIRARRLSLAMWRIARAAPLHDSSRLTSQAQYRAIQARGLPPASLAGSSGKARSTVVLRVGPRCLNRLGETRDFAAHLGGLHPRKPVASQLAGTKAACIWRACGRRPHRAMECPLRG